MQTKLRGGLAKIGLEDNTNCPTCGVFQDGSHLIFDCLDTEDLRVLLRDNMTSTTEWKFFDILSNVHLAGIIADYILAHDIEI